MSRMDLNHPKLKIYRLVKTLEDNGVTCKRTLGQLADLNIMDITTLQLIFEFLGELSPDERAQVATVLSNMDIGKVVKHYDNHGTDKGLGLK